VIVLDCETEEIIGNPLVNPPAVHGIAYLMPGHEPGYLHFRGEKANCKWSTVHDFLRDIWASSEPLLFHNAPFDLACIRAEFMGLKPPHWSRIHDTMFLCYLADPYALSLSLKPSAERYLGMAPEEQDTLTEWILAHVPEATRKTAGAYTVRAPLELISPYAIGDVVRTKALYDHLIDKVPEQAYNRERQIMPILMEASVRGLRVARPALEAALGRAQTALEAAGVRAGALLGVPNAALLTPSELADALQTAGKMSKIVLTPTGRVSTKKKVLTECVNDPDLLDLLRYCGSLDTCINTFMMPWLEHSAADGRLHPEWNQVRTTEKGRYGTRTGRLSCSNPNLQNVPTEFKFEIPAGLDPLPFLRQFLLPEEGHFWLKRDFASQEIRIAAHFEDGILLEAYRRNPSLDPHQMAKDLILKLTGQDFERKHVKITGFQIIYGGGPNAISENVGCSYGEAYNLKVAYFAAMPGIEQLSKEISAVGRSGEAITTWGGRKYYREISAKFPGKDFSYKLLNYLIQGSAADQTKQAIIEWYNPDAGDLLLATVHDEINISAPMDEWELYMERLKEIMNRDRLDCPMLSDGFVGANWHDLEACS
jgi:DNA polymerase I-like protein with 3'-5' exonuclease and polymerase domains